MNKILSMSMLLGAAVLFTACAGEEDDLFDKSAAERLNEMSTVYSNRLEAQPAGWAMQYYPTSDEKGYLILAAFNADHSVRVGMCNAFTRNRYDEALSVWNVITDNGPVLSFNTYNSLLHIFSDPDDTWGGETGTGIGGDYEFVIVDAPEDASYMKLKGKKRGAYTLLTPLDANTDFAAYFQDVIDFQNNYLSSSAPNPYYLKKTTDAGATVFTFEYPESDSRALIAPEGQDAITYGDIYPFLITKRAGRYYLRFHNPVGVGDDDTTQELVYDEAQDKFIDTVNPAIEISSLTLDDFFTTSLEEGHTWTIARKSDQSEKYAAIVDNASEAIKSVNKRYKIDDLQLSRKDDGVCELYFQYGDSKQVARYDFTCQLANGQLTLSFVESQNSGSETIRTRDAAITGLISIFSGTYQLSPAITGLNLSTIRLTSTTDASLWITMSY